eukprot:TRINITY_DN17676_c0_g1_i1.p1 TRINITY_DN17676_c0_g1~~TRINITY_DN17676_c0_g1_i1.p1  ORF type:complete len:152 (+),score=22.62 TRINITY_DN17676_c0_g1_i1:61-516(+)
MSSIGFGDDYALMLYSVPFDLLPQKQLEDPVDFLEQHGKPSGSAISFPPGRIFRFFECLKDLTSLDVLSLVGGGIVGGQYPNEDELCCGGCEREVMLMLVAKLNTLESEQLDSFASKYSFEPDWFHKTLNQFHINCKISLEQGGAVLALFE